MSDVKQAGKLFLVGLGPGDSEHLTFRAREVLAQSEIVVGYKTYIKLIEAQSAEDEFRHTSPILLGKEVVVSGMGKEVERTKEALHLAKAGKKVAIVCSGDAGIYGMAGLVGEMLREQGQDGLEIEIVPGVSSLNTAAALLGAPLMNDFAVISLSDYLVSWEDIGRRLELAAQGDFVIVLYNPKSRHRQHQLVEARGILLRHRSSATPVGIVSNAYRRGQRVVVTDLEHLTDFEIGMTTTIIVGNSSTFTFEKWMVTPRGYGGKYELSDSYLVAMFNNRPGT
jgi:precorrin-3B C17-methyltransferase